MDCITEVSPPDDSHLASESPDSVRILGVPEGEDSVLVFEYKWRVKVIRFFKMNSCSGLNSTMCRKQSFLAKEKARLDRLSHDSTILVQDTGGLFAWLKHIGANTVAGSRKQIENEGLE